MQQAYTPVLVCDVVRLGYRFSVFKKICIYLVIYESNNIHPLPFPQHTQCMSHILHHKRAVSMPAIWVVVAPESASTWLKPRAEVSYAQLELLFALEPTRKATNKWTKWNTLVPYYFVENTTTTKTLFHCVERTNNQSFSKQVLCRK